MLCVSVGFIHTMFSSCLAVVFFVFFVSFKLCLILGLAKLLITFLSLPSLNLSPFYLLSCIFMVPVVSVCRGT